MPISRAAASNALPLSVHRMTSFAINNGRGLAEKTWHDDRSHDWERMDSQKALALPSRNRRQYLDVEAGIRTGSLYLERTGSFQSICKIVSIDSTLASACQYSPITVISVTFCFFPSFLSSALFIYFINREEIKKEVSKG